MRLPHTSFQPHPQLSVCARASAAAFARRDPGRLLLPPAGPAQPGASLRQETGDFEKLPPLPKAVQKLIGTGRPDCPVCHGVGVKVLTVNAAYRPCECAGRAA